MSDDHYTVFKQRAPILAYVDVVVVGGGFPGVCAALASSRAGATVAIVERDGMLGDQAAEIYTFGLDGFFDDSGRQFVRGIPWEIMRKTIAEGQSDAIWEGVDYGRMEREGLDKELFRFGMKSRTSKSQTFVNPSAFRYVLQTLVDEAGQTGYGDITTFFESLLSGIILEDTRIKGIVAQGSYGPFAIEGTVMVDTTPHAGVAALAGKPFPYPQVYTGSHPRVAGVDIHKLIAYIAEHPDDVDIPTVESKDPDCLREQIDQGMALLMRGFGKLLEKAIADDPIYRTAGRDDPPSLCFFYDRDGCGTYWIRSREYSRPHLDDPMSLSKTIAETRKQQWLTHKLFRDYVPGFEHAHLVDIHPHIARALLRSQEPGAFTEHDIPWEHIQDGGNLYKDSIARVMGHPEAGQAPHGFQVPYRSLIPKGLDGLLVIGKPACRFFHYHGTNAALGQAAGVAAAVAAKDEVPLRELDVRKVQEQLERQGAVVF